MEGGREEGEMALAEDMMAEPFFLLELEGKEPTL
jgi:hypothetical protein